MIYEINHYYELRKWHEKRNDRRSERNLCNCIKKPEKNSGLQRGLNPWLRDTGAMLYQLSYEATDVGSRSIVGSYVPVKEMSVNDIWNKSYMNCGNEMKMKKWSLQWMQFMQLRKEAWKKFRTSTGFEPVTSRYRCNALPTELWSHHWSPEFFFQASLHVHYHPVPQPILKSHYRVCLLLYFYFRRRIFCWEIYDTSLVMRTIMQTLFKKSVTLNKIWHISRTIFNVHIDNTLSIRGIDKIFSSREEACLY